MISHSNENLMSSRGIINTMLLKEQLRRSWIISAAFLLLYILSVILILIVDGNSRDVMAQARFMADTLSMSHPMLNLAMIFAPFCIVSALYPYYFSDTAAATFYTFPVTKRQLFLTNFVAGAILLILPVLILSIMLLVPVYFEAGYRILHTSSSLFPNGQIFSFETVNTFHRVFGFFMRMAVGMMFYFGVFKLAISVSGSRVIFVLLSGFFPLVPVILHALISSIGAVYVFGLSNARAGEQIVATMSFTNPVTWAVIIHRDINLTYAIFSSLLPNYIIYIAITITLFAVAYICARKRKHERIGDSIVFTPLKNVMVFAASMFGMIIMGLFFLGLNEGRFMLYTGFAVGFVLSYLMAQMLMERTLNIKHKLKALPQFSAIMLATYLLMFIITTYVMGFYLNRIPAQENIVGISIENDRNAHFVTDADIIARTIDMHNEILSNRAYINEAFWNDIIMGWRFPAIYIAYLLENGSIIFRQYHVPQNFMRNLGFDELRQEPQILLARYRLLYTPQAIDFIMINLGGIHGSIVVREDLAPLIEAIKEDYTRNVILRRAGQGSGIQDRYNAGIYLSPNIDSDIIVPFHFNWMHFDVFRDGAVMQWLTERGYLN